VQRRNEHGGEDHDPSDEMRREVDLDAGIGELPDLSDAAA